MCFKQELNGLTNGINLCLQRPDNGLDRYAVMSRASATTNVLKDMANSLGLTALEDHLDNLELGSRKLLWEWDNLAREQIVFYMEQFSAHANSISHWITTDNPVRNGDYR